MLHSKEAYFGLTSTDTIKGFSWVSVFINGNYETKIQAKLRYQHSKKASKRGWFINYDGGVYSVSRANGKLYINICMR